MHRGSIFVSKKMFHRYLRRGPYFQRGSRFGSKISSGGSIFTVMGGTNLGGQACPPCTSCCLPFAVLNPAPMLPTNTSSRAARGPEADIGKGKRGEDSR